jgi:hypothetical protein
MVKMSSNQFVWHKNQALLKALKLLAINNLRNYFVNTTLLGGM